MKKNNSVSDLTATIMEHENSYTEINKRRILAGLLTPTLYSLQLYSDESNRCGLYFSKGDFLKKDLPVRELNRLVFEEICDLAVFGYISQKEQLSLMFKLEEESVKDTAKETLKNMALALHFPQFDSWKILIPGNSPDALKRRKKAAKAAGIDPSLAHSGNMSAFAMALKDSARTGLKPVLEDLIGNRDDRVPTLDEDIRFPEDSRVPKKWQQLLRCTSLVPLKMQESCMKGIFMSEELLDSDYLPDFDAIRKQEPGRYEILMCAAYLMAASCALEDGQSEIPLSDNAEEFFCYLQKGEHKECVRHIYGLFRESEKKLDPEERTLRLWGNDAQEMTTDIY